MFYLPRDRASAEARGWQRFSVEEFPWPIPGEAFWRLVGDRDAASASGRSVYRRELRFPSRDQSAYLIAVDGGPLPGDRGDRVAYLVQVGTELFALSGVSAVIHRLNERLGGPRDSFIEDYLEFFCSFVAGDEGPFLIPRSREERDEMLAQDNFAVSLQRARARVVLRDAREDAAQQGAQSAVPDCRLERAQGAELELARDAAAKAGRQGIEDSAFLRAHVIYGQAAFVATFVVARDGDIAMLDDDPLAALQTVTRHRFVDEGGVSWLVREWGGRDRERITAFEFLERVFAAQEGAKPHLSCPTLRQLEVDGDVVLPACRPLPWLHCEDVDFHGSVMLDDCRATDRVTFDSCRIFGSFSARRAQFDKSLVFRRNQVFALIGENGRPATREQDRWGCRDFGAAVGICLESARVQTDLDLERSTCHATLRARRLVVGGNTNLAGIRVLPTVVRLPKPAQEQEPKGAGETTLFAACSTPVVLDLSDGEFGGSIALNCALDHAAIAQMGQFASHCHRPVVVGTLRLDGVRIQCSLWIRGLGVLTMQAIRGAGTHGALLSLRQARIEGGLQNYENVTHPWPPTRILGEVDLSFAQMGNYAQLSGFFITGDLEFGALTAQSVTLSAEWRFPEPAPDRDHGGAEPWFDYTGGRRDAIVDSWRPCYVGGNVNFNNARISGTVFLDGVWIDGTLRARDGARLGSILLGSSVSLSTDPQPDGSSLGLTRNPARVGAVVIETAEIAGTIAILDTQVASEISIVNSRIAGDLDFFGKNLLRRSYVQHLTSSFSWPDKSFSVADFVERELGNSAPATVVGGGVRSGDGVLRVAGSAIGGTVDLRNVRVNGDLWLEDSTIAADLATASPRVLGGAGQRFFHAMEGGQRAVTPMLDLQGCRAAVLEVHGECIDEVVPPKADHGGSELGLRTECRRFVFDSLQCRGDARLWRVHASRSMSGRNAHVSGSLSFFVAGEGIGTVPVHSGEAGERSVNLERASVEQLTIVEPFPPNVFLRGVRVGQWSPKSALHAGSVELADSEVDWPQRAALMLKVLERMPQVEPAVYLDVERYFRASGQDELADEVYRALRDRQAVLDEAACDCRKGLWLWLALLVPPLAVVVAAAMGVPAAGRWLKIVPDAATIVGLLAGLLAPWLLAWACPPHSSRELGRLQRTFAAGGLSGGLVRGMALAVAIASILLSESVQVVLTVAALTIWIQVVLLMPLLVAFERLRSLVVGRLMLRLGTGWGTAAHRLVLVWVFLLLAPLAIVLHQPSNVEPSLLARGALKASAGDRPDGDAWRWDGFEAPPIWLWMAVEATVPIISLGAEDKWEAADLPPAQLACHAEVAAEVPCRVIAIPFGTSPKQVEAFLRLIGWMFWPLAAAGFAASFIHRRQSSA